MSNSSNRESLQVDASSQVTGGVHDTAEPDPLDFQGVESVEELSLSAQALLAQERPAWSRMPGEPRKWWHIFTNFYLQAGLQRSILGAYRKYLRSEYADEAERQSPWGDFAARLCPPQWYEIAATWEWKRRAAAWDDYQTALSMIVWHERRQKLREREWEGANKLFDIIEQTLDTYANDDKTKIPLATLPRIVDVASRMARLASELATEHKALNVTRQGSDDLETVREQRWSQVVDKLADLQSGQTATVVVEGEIVDG